VKEELESPTANTPGFDPDWKANRDKPDRRSTLWRLRDSDEN
jgi:hypothetical protein